MTEPLLSGRLLLTPAEAARALSIGRTRVYELMTSGQLPSVKIGRSRRIPVAALASFLKELSSESAA